MNELVQLTTADVSRAIPVTTSRMVADEFERNHQHVLRNIRELLADISDLSTSGLIYYCVADEYVDGNGRKQTEYKMNESFFMLLAMGFKGKKALEFKTKFIKAFTLMRAELLARAETRSIGKVARLSITNAINQHVSNTGNFKKFAYSNYTKLVYKRILGMDVKHAKEARKVPENGNLRDYLTIEELDRVQELESKIAGFIEISDTTGKDDKAVYAMVKAYVDSLTK